LGKSNGDPSEFNFFFHELQQRLSCPNTQAWYEAQIVFQFESTW